MRDYPEIELHWKEIGLSFQVQFVKKNYTVDNNTENIVNVPNGKRDILNLIKQNDSISIAELAKELSISDRQCKRIIAELKQEGFLIRVGSNRTGYWKITK